MTTKREQAGYHPDSPFAMPDKCLNATSFVIPAKAGIQWFRPDIPACKQAGMTFLTYPDGLHTLKDTNNH